ncbi:hypothetical protein SAMN05660662_3665 [Blastococcus aurantiacus]|uniref:Uncharacterized protein n=1 Tax=Blastococcus aurantiacus TaxID=1550231 RepID=A0A1G7PPB8_9ACTN|nr:hypothetical protein [Blastococcus aurantiacus]SDF88143.1 hypothetical protein SAMN05660662_3665 [Blastococcus aurantiacus]
MTDVKGNCVPARDARTGAARAARPRTAGGAAAAGSRDRVRPGRPGPSGGEGLVIGTVPAGARFAGVLLLLAALAGLVSAFPTYLEVDGQELVLGGSVLGVLATLLVPLVGGAVGVLLVRGTVPKFGLAYASVAGALSLGNLLIELYRGRSSTDRPGVEVLAGEQVLTSDIHIGAGWVAGLVALALTVLAGCVAAAVWGRTVMDDRGTLDAVRGPLAGTTLLLGVGTVLSLALPAADVRDDLVLDPATGLEVVVTREGPQALLERPGLALLGGLLLAGALVLCSVTAPSLRPRLAAVGGLLAITVTVLAAGISGLRDAVVSDDLDWTLPGVGLVVAGLGFAVLTVLAWRLRRSS